jgi:hypothetical protein
VERKDWRSRRRGRLRKNPVQFLRIVEKIRNRPVLSTPSDVIGPGPGDATEEKNRTDESFSFDSTVAVAVIWTKIRGNKRRTNKKAYFLYY